MEYELPIGGSRLPGRPQEGLDRWSSISCLKRRLFGFCNKLLERAAQCGPTCYDLFSKVPLFAARCSDVTDGGGSGFHLDGNAGTVGIGFGLRPCAVSGFHFATDARSTKN
jgi:hypothetical protein